MPRYSIDRATNFIIEEESWTVVEYDHTSVPGVVYLSLTEGKINSLYDDLENNIADTDKLAQYELSVPAETQTFTVGDIITPSFTLTKNGIPSNEEVELISTNKKIAHMINNELIAVSEGNVDIEVRLKNYPSISTILHINIKNNESIFSAYIEGPASIRLDREAEYTLIGTSEIIDGVQFTIDDSNLAKIINVTGNKCKILANEKNKLGKVTLTAHYNDVDYTKIISIIPLW